MVYNTTLMMPALLIYPDGIIFLLTKEHSSVFPFQWVWRNEFSVLICLKLFLFHLQFWRTVSQAMKFSVACYFLSALWRYCFLILWFLFFFFFSCLYYCSSFENTMFFFSGSCQDFYCLQFSLLSIMIWCAIVLY